MHEVDRHRSIRSTALAVGLKVDVDALPPEIIAALQAGQVDLTDPAVTVALLRLNAVVGVRGKVNDVGQLTSVGITCALCHSTVDNSFDAGIGQRLDGWANPDLNVGAIVALSPALDDATKAEFTTVGSWQVRSAPPRVRRHEYHSAEQPVAADRHPADLRAEGRRLRDLHRRRPDLVLEQLRRRRTDGRPGHVQRSAHRPLDQADARSRDAEAAGAARLPAESARRRAPPTGSFDRAAARRGKRLSATKPAAPPAIRGRTSPMSSTARVGAAVPARSGRGRHRSGLRRAERHRAISDDAAARALAARAVLPRRQRRRSARGGQSLQPAVRR